MRGIVAERAPRLAASEEAIVSGKILSTAQIEELVDVLMDALWEEEDAVEGFTQRGNEIDNLIGIVFQWSEDFFR